jgi:hypothetical protein
MKSKKIWIFISIGIIVVLALGSLFFLLKGNYESHNMLLNQSNQAPSTMLALCQQRQHQISLNSGNYTVFIFGIVNGTCHWLYMDKTMNETKNCYYPLNFSLNSTFYLYGMVADNFSSQCSNFCPQEIQMVQNYCK